MKSYLLLLVICLFFGAAIPSPHLKDGRFTLGTSSKKSLLFGYPYNYSTSHFIVSANGRYGTNTDQFYQGVKYLKGEQTLSNQKASLRSETKYLFANIILTQKLIPVNSQFEEVSEGKWAEYYRVEYQVINTAFQAQRVNLGVMLDVMIDHNDACQSIADGKEIHLDQQFEGAKVPKKFTFYKNINKKSGDKLLVLTQTANTPAPDAAFVGQWVFLSNVLDFSKHEVKPFTSDDAIMLNWMDKVVASNDTLTLACYVGSPGQDISVQHHQPRGKVSKTVYFESGKSNLSEASKKEIETLVRATNPKAVLIEGYTDAAGSTEKNLKLSEERIENVSVEVQMYGIPFKKLLKKSHGEFYGNEFKEDEQQERKVIISIWR